MLWLLTGLLLSVVWSAACVLWVADYYGWENLLYLAPFEQAMVVAGIIAPLALLWSLVGLLFLAKRLAALTAELRQRQASLEPLAPTTMNEPSTSAMPAAPRLDAAVPAPSATEKAPPDNGPLLRAPASVDSPASPRLSVAAEAMMTAPRAYREPEPFLTAPPAVGAPLSPVMPDPVSSIAQEVAKALGRIQAAPEAVAAPGGANAEFDAKIKQTSRDLNAISMDLSALLCVKNQRDDALKSFNKGEREAFHELLRKHIAGSNRTDIMRRLVQADSLSLLHSFSIKFGSLIDEAQKLDPAGHQEHLLADTAIGRLYAEVQRLMAGPRSGAA